jgi:hypothetical protein
MGRRIALGIAGLAVSAGAVLGIGHANADPGDQNTSAYWAIFKKWDPTATAAQARNNAEMFCGLRRGGSTEAEVVAMFNDGDLAGAQMIVRGAEYHFCPSYWSRS